MPRVTMLSFQNNPMLAQEMDRIAKGQPMPPLDVDRYKLVQPDDDADVSEWQAAAENSKTQLEHQQLRYDCRCGCL